MADNVPITAGSGTKVSTEEVTTLNGGAVEAQHIQRTVPATRTADGTAIDEAAGSGAVTSATKRVVLATDDPAVVALQLIDSAIAGPGGPTIDSYSSVAINLTTGTNQVLVSSAANKQIWVYGWALTCGDANGQTVSLQDEDDAAKTGIMEFGQYGGISVPPSGNFSMPVFKLATDKDLEIDITGGDVDGILYYAIVSV